MPRPASRGKARLSQQQMCTCQSGSSPRGGAWLVVSSLGASRPIESCGYKAYGHSPFGVSGLFFFQNGSPPFSSSFFLLSVFLVLPCKMLAVPNGKKKKSPQWRYRSVKKELEKPSESLLPRKSEVAPPQAKPYKTPVAPHVCCQLGSGLCSHSPVVSRHDPGSFLFPPYFLVPWSPPFTFYSVLWFNLSSGLWSSGTLTHPKFLAAF